MKNRTIHLFIIIVLVGLTILGRLFYLQVIDDSYQSISKNSSVREFSVIAPRGEVVDRNGDFLAQSRESYDLTVTPRELKEFDTISVCRILNIDKKEFEKLLAKSRRYSPYQASVLVHQIDYSVKLRFDELDIAGFGKQFRTVRSYPFNTAGNILGYVGEVNSRELREDDYYRMSDYIGKTGIESQYENELRGEKGKDYVIMDAYGRNQGSFNDGAMDIPPVQGTKITLSIDQKLQSLAEKLMVGKIGSVVAIEPETGEILAMVSSPTFNPDTLIGANRSRNYMNLLRDNRKPLFNRSIKATYPPGSTFKMALALMALQEGVVTPEDKFECHGGYKVKGLKVGCHHHISPLAMEYAIQVSCNAYFCEVFRKFLNDDKFDNIKDGFDRWEEYVRSFGFGKTLGCDIGGELGGFVPSREFYDRAYNKRWNSLSVISLAIGQAELSITPLQLANFASIIANRGYYYTPHLLKKFNDEDVENQRFTTKNYTMVESKYFEPIVEAMWKGVNVKGTGAIAKVEGLDICGKTGTAQNGKGADHSTFIAFAPKDNPKIAISAYVEYGIWGSTAAAPIVSLMTEQYLTDTIKRPWLVDRMLNMKLNYPVYDNQ